jgi:hypothetical protein
MPKQSTLAKGFARGLTADLAGVAGDTANNMANLLRAGFGYAGHKLGMLKAEDMPELVENKDSPFTSDWLAKNTPLEDVGESGYTAARIAGGLAPALVGFAKGSVGAKPTAPGVMDEKGALLMPEHLISRNKLNLASDAVVRLPSGGFLRPVDAPIDLKRLADLKQNPQEIPLPELYPKLAGTKDFAFDTIGTTPLAANLGGYHSPLMGRSVINSNRSLPDMANTADHEINHSIQTKGFAMDTGSNPTYFSDPDYKKGFAEGGKFANTKNYFPGLDLEAYQAQLQQNPLMAYRNSEGEIVARIGGGAAELMSQGGSQVPTQQLLDALTRREGGFKNANIRLVLKNWDTNQDQQLHLPAYLGKELKNTEEGIFNNSGAKIGYSPAYR